MDVLIFSEDWPIQEERSLTMFFSVSSCLRLLLLAANFCLKRIEAHIEGSCGELLWFVV